MFKLTSSDDREAWLEARQHVVTATDVTVLIGSNPFKTMRELWLDKQGESTFKGNAKSRIGQALEGSLVDWAAAQLPGLTTANDILFAHDAHPWAAATPDGLNYLDGETPAGVIEAKTTTAWLDPVPQYVVDQVQWQMFVTGAEVAWVPRLFGLEALDLFSVDRDEERIAELFDVAYLFFTDHLLTGEGPDVTAPPVLEGAEYLLDAYRDASARIKMLEAVKKGYRSEIFGLLDGEVVATAGGHTVKVGVYEKQGVDVGLLREKYPDIANECTVTSVVQTLRVN